MSACFCEKIWSFFCLLLLSSLPPAMAQSVSLDVYLLIAQQNSPLLHEYRNNVRSLSLDSQLIRARYLPQINFTSTNYYPVTGKNFGYDEAITNGGQFSSLVGASKTFVGAENRNTQFRTISLGADSLRNATSISEQDLTRTVTAQYLTTYGDQQLLFANEAISKLLQNENIILETLTRNNVYRQTDYLTFLVTLKQQELQLKQLRIKYQTDFATLNYLCGIIDTASASKTLQLPQMEVSLFEDALQSAFFRRYAVDSLLLVNEAQLISLAYRPALTLTADAGYNAVAIRNVYRNFGLSGGIGVTFPIFNGGRKKLNLQKISLREDTRQAYYSFFKKQYSQQITSLLQQLASTEALNSDIETQITYTEGLINVNEKLLQTGDARIADLVIAINNFLTAQNLKTQNEISRLQIINQVNYWNR